MYRRWWAGAWGWVGAALAGVAVVVPLELRDQALLAGLLFAAGLTVHWLSRGHTATLLLVFLSLVVSSRYLFWRLTSTFRHDGSVDLLFGGLLLGAELYAFAMLLLGYLQPLQPLNRKPVPLPPDPGQWPTVDLFIPTYDEALSVVRATVLAAKAIDWPRDRLRIHLLDDGKRDSFRAFAAHAGVGYLRRSDNRHAKAGNLNHALGQTSGEFVAIFDCDHVPTRSFLQLAMGSFLGDPKLAMVQTPHHFYSPDPFERNLSLFRQHPNEGELFYGLIQKGNDLWNAVLFCGSCAILRRSALEEVGGVAVETVTEDAHTALKLHRRGYSTAYLGIPQAGGLATESLAAHVGQRIRWARGMAQIFRVDNPLLGRGLSLWQRLCYLGSMLHFFYGIPRLIFLLAPLSYLLFDLQIFHALPVVALAYGLPHLFHLLLTNARVQGAFRRSFWSEVYETCLAPYLVLPTLMALVSPRLGKFNVTAKGGKIPVSYFDRRIAAPHLALTALNLLGLSIGGWRLWTGVGHLDVLAMNLAWTGYNLVILGATLAVARESRQLRAHPRVAVKLPAMLRLGAGRTARATTVDLSYGGCSLQVAPGAALAPGERVQLSLEPQRAEVPLPAEVVAVDGGTVRLQFAPLSLEQESALVGRLFSRADAWLQWRSPQPDRPPLVFLDLVRRALSGLWRALRPARPEVVPPTSPRTEGRTV